MKPLISRSTPVMLSSQHQPQSGHSINGPKGSARFQALEAMEREADLIAQAGQGRWMVPYADLVTLLLGLFLALFTAASPVNKTKAEAQPLAQKMATVLAAEKAPAKNPSDALEQRLRKTMRLPGMEILHQERGIVISLKDSILFEAGQADLSPAARQTLDKLADELAGSLNASSNKMNPIRVEGHTDNSPIATSQYPSNWELSTARATHIVRYLVSQRHWSPAMISAAGYGEFRPLHNNSSIEGKRKNRRVDIVILNESTANQEPPAAVEKPIAQKLAVATQPTSLHISGE